MILCGREIIPQILSLSVSVQHIHFRHSFQNKNKTEVNLLIQRLTAHYFKSPVQPIADEISGVDVSLRNLTAVIDSQWEFNTAPRTLPIQI